MIILQLCLFLLPAILINFYCLRKGEHFIIGISDGVSLKDIVRYVAILLLSIPFVSFISQISHEILSFPFFSEIKAESIIRDEELKGIYDMLLLNATPLRYVINIIAICLVPAVSEEFFFRGVLQNLFTRNMKNKVVAVLLSSVIFSLVHFQVSEFLSRVILGFIIGYAYLYSGNIWVSVIMHAVNNIIALVLYPFKGLDSFMTEWWVILLSVILMILIVLYIRTKVDGIKSNE